MSDETAAYTHGRCSICGRRLKLTAGLIPRHKDSRSIWCLGGITVPVAPEVKQ